MKKQIMAIIISLAVFGVALSMSVQVSVAASRDTLRVALYSRAPSLDVWNSASNATLVTVENNIGQGLFAIDPKTYEAKPLLATSHELVNDTTWEIRLRKGVTFSNGEPFNASSVKYTLERVIDQKRKLYDRAVWHKIIDRVDIIDNYTVRIITKTPYPVLVKRLSTKAPMIPPQYTEEKGDAEYGEHPIGTGPYKLVSWKRGEEIILTRRDDYWGSLPAIKTLHFRIIPEQAVAQAELISGGIDVFTNLPADQAATVKKSKRATIYAPITKRIYFLVLDGDGRGGPTPFQNLKVRQAVYHAIDRQTLADVVDRGFSKVANGMIFERSFGYDPSIKNLEPEYNPEKARQLLAEAGYPNGFKAQFSGYVGKTVMEAVQGYLRKVGIETTLNYYGADTGTLIKLRNAGKVKDFAMYSWGLNIYDAEATLPYWFGYRVSKNYNNDRQLGDWIDEASQTMDPKLRAELYLKIQHRIIGNAYAVPLLFNGRIFGINKDLNFVSVGEYPLFTQCSWK